MRHFFSIGFFMMFVNTILFGMDISIESQSEIKYFLIVKSTTSYDESKKYAEVREYRI